MLQKRKGWDRNFGQHSDSNRLNRLVEAVERAVGFAQWVLVNAADTGFGSVLT